MEAWTQFFIRAGIPKEVAAKYAKSFQTNRIKKEMLPDLDKTTLSELGVTAIGDQLCILRRIKAAKASLEAKEEEMEEEEELEEPEISPVKKIKSRITAPEGYTLNLTSSSSSASEQRRGKPPPDRNEIYHVKMPVGNTHRTRQILQKAEKMRQQGLAVRGTTGVRQGGRSVSPIDKSSLAARIHKKQSAEVSSSTDNRHGASRHPTSGPATKISRIATSSIKKTISNRPSLSSRLTTSSSGSSSSAPIRVHLNEERGAQKGSRIEGRLQKVSKIGKSLTREGRNEQAEQLVVEYEDDGVELEEVYLEEDGDQMEYEEVDESQIVTVQQTPIRSRITYSSGNVADRTGSYSGGVNSRISSAPRHHQHQNYHNRNQREDRKASIHSRVSYRRY